MTISNDRLKELAEKWKRIIQNRARDEEEILEDSEMEQHLFSMLTELRDEMEKERAAVTLSVNASAFWLDNRHVVDYETAFEIEKELRAKLAAAEQRIGELEGDNAGLIAACESLEQECIGFTDPRIAQLEAQLKGASAALEPFDISGEGDEDFDDETQVIVKFGRTTCYSMRLKHLRNVSKALAELSRLEQEGK
jgi:hypothetical protein